MSFDNLKKFDVLQKCWHGTSGQIYWEARRLMAFESVSLKHQFKYVYIFLIDDCVFKNFKNKKKLEHAKKKITICIVAHIKLVFKKSYKTGF